MTTGWDRARTIADAVLYEGYLLYPYRASSRKNQCRWQFGVLGPPGAADAGIGEEGTLDTQFLVADGGTLTLVVRFLQLQHRQAERLNANRWVPVDELDDTRWALADLGRGRRVRDRLRPAGSDRPPAVVDTAIDGARWHRRSRTSTAAGWYAPGANCAVR